MYNVFMCTNIYRCVFYFCFCFSLHVVLIFHVNAVNNKYVKVKGLFFLVHMFLDNLPAQNQWREQNAMLRLCICHKACFAEALTRGATLGWAAKPLATPPQWENICKGSSLVHHV